MEGTIDMQMMRYLNIFSRIAHVETQFCFKYNEGLVFCVPKQDLSRALGRNAENVRQISQMIRKRVKIVACPRGIQDAKEFVENVVSPIQFKDLQVTPDEIIINAGGIQSKAALFGRNKKRFEEMQEVLRNYFKRNLRII
ncbi:hypothetical protein J4474_02155 [Candidatus Pacearchaeota archaeon]|nr:hypothetical protein [Candidatus Pacearchaeota archaeon]